jgi:hypothetical protein
MSPRCSYELPDITNEDAMDTLAIFPDVWSRELSQTNARHSANVLLIKYNCRNHVFLVVQAFSCLDTVGCSTIVNCGCVFLPCVICGLKTGCCCRSLKISYCADVSSWNDLQMLGVRLFTYLHRYRCLGLLSVCRQRGLLVSTRTAPAQWDVHVNMSYWLSGCTQTTASGK